QLRGGTVRAGRRLFPIWIDASRRLPESPELGPDELQPSFLFLPFGDQVFDFLLERSLLVTQFPRQVRISDGVRPRRARRRGGANRSKDAQWGLWPGRPRTNGAGLPRFRPVP